ncbi:hypothetical protein AB0395_39770 [Streptosporangium sp. NPDC051023]|uniref:phage distal tail protein n=1 Tax=Streptosporangium sp. NPDC051023 TaxID=3155410 RepID=UPI00344C2ECE
MARLGRSYYWRPVIARQRYRLDNSITLGAFEISAEFPAVTATTPDAFIPLGAFEISAEFPALSLSNDLRRTLPAFEIAAEFPSLSVSVPVQPGDLITGDFQIEWGGLLFGAPDGVYQILAESVEGWDDLPGMDSGNVARPSRHGSWAGRRLSQDRQVSAIIGIDTSVDFTTALSEIRRVLVPPDDETENTLVISTRDEVLLAYAAVDARVIPPRDYAQGWAPVSVRWVCSDPRRYGITRQGATVPLSTPTELYNGGNTATHPLIRLQGPVTNPVLENDATGRALYFSITVASNERLDIDTDVGTVTIGSTNKMSALTGASAPVQDFVLLAGSNSLTYTATSGGSAGADFLWRDAHL